MAQPTTISKIKTINESNNNKKKNRKPRGKKKNVVYNIIRFKYPVFNNNKMTRRTKKKISIVYSKRKKINQQRWVQGWKVERAPLFGTSVGTEAETPQV